MITFSLAKSEGIKPGIKVADAVPADRANDGTNAPDTYRRHAAPGAYVPTATPLWEHYAPPKRWVFKSADQFRPGPPPALSSSECARDYGVRDADSAHAEVSVDAEVEDLNHVRLTAGHRDESVLARRQRLFGPQSIGPTRLGL